MDLSFTLLWILFMTCSSIVAAVFTWTCSCFCAFELFYLLAFINYFLDCCVRLNAPKSVFLDIDSNDVSKPKSFFLSFELSFEVSMSSNLHVLSVNKCSRVMYERTYPWLVTVMIRKGSGVKNLAPHMVLESNREKIRPFPSWRTLVCCGHRASCLGKRRSIPEYSELFMGWDSGMLVRSSWPSNREHTDTGLGSERVVFALDRRWTTGTWATLMAPRNYKECCRFSDTLVWSLNLSLMSWCLMC